MTVAAQQLLDLAQSRNAGDRERLLLALADLCVAGDAGEAAAPPVQALISSVFMTLVAEAEHDIRQALAERLARCAWAPHTLIKVLAMDEIDIARPIIAASPVLADQDLVRMLTEATIEHQIAVATRPMLCEAVVEEILRQREPAVLTALAANDTADVTPAAMDFLVEASREIAALRSPLARHPRLTAELAERLYAWVGQSLRTAIVSRFEIDPAALDHELARAVHEAQHPDGPSPGPAYPAVYATPRELEQRLAAKLKASGQLRPGYLFKALRDHRIGLFAAALSELTALSPDEIDRVLGEDDPSYLALACLAAGVDRSAFPTVLEWVRKLNDQLPGGDDAGAMATYATEDPSHAVAALKIRLAGG